MENNNNNNIPKLIPLDKKFGPKFPLDTLPTILRKFVSDVAHSYQVPPDLLGVLTLAACATAIGKQYKVEINNDWSEPCNIFVGVAMPPASRKSPVFKVVMAPLEKAEQEHYLNNKDAIDDNKQTRNIIINSIKQAEKLASKSESIEDRNIQLERIKQLKSELPLNDHSLRLTADDVTPERMNSLLSENNGRLSIVSAEGGIFNTIAGRYSNAPNMDVLLKGHAGDMIKVDRVGRETEIITDPALTMGLAFQPEVLQDIFKVPGFRGLGLLGRFLFVMPNNLIGDRITDPAAVGLKTKADYNNCIRWLIEDLIEFEKNTLSKPYVLKLTEEAQNIFRIYRNQQEKELKHGGKLDGMNDWGGKLPGVVARLMGILHIVKHGSESRNHDIDGEIVESCIRLGNYFTDHANIAFSIMGSDDKTTNAHKIIEWMIENNLNKISIRNIHQALRSTFHSIKELLPIINLLKDKNYIQLTSIENNNSGRKPSPTIYLHPDLLSQNTHNTQNAV